jgi:hypothetical protein
MPGIKAFTKYVSDDVSISLAQQALAGTIGIGTATFVANVSNVSNTTPMVVTTSTNHGLQTGQWITIFGALGNAPGGPPNPDAYQHSINGAWQIIVLSPTTFSVWDGVNMSSGSPVGVTAGVSNGTYTSGGAIYLGPLTDGHILLGRQHVAEGSSPPRIIFVFKRSEWGDKGMYSPATAAVQPSDRRYQWLARSLVSEIYVVEVHVWGAFVPVDPEGGDKDATQLLYQQVIRSIDLMVRGAWDLTPGAFTREQAGQTALNTFGEEFVFQFKIGTPVLESVLEFVPSGTKPSITFSPNPSTG